MPSSSCRPLRRSVTSSGVPTSLTAESYRAVAGLGLILAAAIYFTFGLVFNALHEATLTPAAPASR